ncbi:probable RNA-binding protein CG14230 isoform X1 [Hylaeus volcanicus]|uniref:probable RNA-binding protein CG14230 isoform X1 n=1 Tax=Hylaeus volcanicus TaxID=313075 RepID=UPI0023B86790|nr:probable RNA-binding protein CG14230 isoform X1 [Hylaeus volcanicus]
MDAVEHEYSKTNEINESEKKRLKSLKEKRETYRAKELLIQNALKSLDNKSNANKIIFDEDIDQVQQPRVKKIKKKKRDLFDDDEGKDNELLWDDSTFEVAKKPCRQSITLGNDERFKLDKRFMDDDCEVDKNITTDNIDECDLQKEKEWQLDILENILGVPIQDTSKSKETHKDVKFPRKQMIRYDPTESNHKEYEIIEEKSELPTKNVKKNKRAKGIIEDPAKNSITEVSKDVYYSVSESLSKSLKEGGQFSLLKTSQKAETNEKEDHEYNAPTIDSSNQPKFHFSFDRKNPFKYDSSDDENDNKEKEPEKKHHINHISTEINKFFFDINDTRFNEAVQFFSKESVPDSEFKNLRRELKQIVRLKVQRNVKKNQPYGRKKKIKR